MKKILVIALLLIAAVLVVPGVVGYQAEQRYRALVGQIDASGLEVVEDDYRRGWFGADAVTRIRLPLSAGGATDTETRQELVLRSRISHGPLTAQGVALAEIDTDLESGGTSLSARSGSTIRTMIAIDGTGHTRIRVPEQEIEQGAGDPTLRFLGLEGEIDFDLDREKGDFRFRSPGILVQQEGRTLVQLDRLELDSRTWRGVSGLMLGAGRLTIDRIGMDAPDLPGRVELRGLSVTGESGEQGGAGELVSVALEYRLAGLDYGKRHYSDGVLRMAASRLYAPVLLRIQQTTEQMQQRRMSEAEVGMAMMGLLTGQLPDLLRQDPKLVLEPIGLTTPEGVVKAGLSLQSVGLRVADLQDQARLLARLEGRASLRLPETLFREMLQQQNLLALQEQQAATGAESAETDREGLQGQARQMAQQQLQQWLDQGLLQRDGDALQSRVVLSGGRLQINGRTVPLPQS
ncbi:MAG TPA: DUF945 domain-containing protein [Sedimenticola thiotaurini]|uniref:DUF945 domain-containing protein n=1 Tax=Sedimenticola thiotaurini TaxID=1543721 RepID=A0A831RRQ7_9GAMM|nr:DUF945 domain-containing protein [Sedimenticola thiotaurini]